MEQEKINKNRVIENIVIITMSLVVVAVIIALLYTVIFNNDSVKDTDIYSKDIDMSPIEEVINKIKNKYIGEVPNDAILEGAIRGMLEATEDPYTRYVTEEEYQEMMTEGTQQYGGLGIHITYDKEMDAILVLSVMPDSPAEQSGIHAGDYIKKVDTIAVTYDTYNQAVDGMKGESGSKVSLTIIRENKEMTFTCTRKIISANNIESKMLESNVGYIKIVSFENNVAMQFMKEYNKLISNGATSMIIDLRNNPGGLLDEVVTIAQNLLPKGEIVKLVYKDGREKKYASDGSKEAKIPLAVLVNGRSASASEILTGSLKDHKKATIIGETTYGKGIVQSVEKLKSFKGAVSVTTSEYYTASGNAIHKNGITPDVQVKLEKEYENKNFVPIEHDLQLKKAIEILTKK